MTKKDKIELILTRVYELLDKATEYHSHDMSPFSMDKEEELTYKREIEVATTELIDTLERTIK